ncbi:hypothetical protein ACFQY0_18730 [Haloferula chungangensis]|uniref:XRE family transcriptional regulator n=1 Tax=Haloferula chungangensis TaxID=1048331 RepID=A0ABW2LCJ6_9BACT
MHHRPAHPYLIAWLRRTRKQLAKSGRLSETALILSQKEGGHPSTWSTELRAILEGDVIPSLDLITMIDSILARPTAPLSQRDCPLLF